MKKAFIFDVDGVLINGEPSWEKLKETFFLPDGPEVYQKMQPVVGLSIEGTFEKAKQAGSKKTLDEYREFVHITAESLYKTAPLTEGIDELGNMLLKHNFVIGIVSASPRKWIEDVINRLSFKDGVSVILSLEERKELAHKPSPDGYIVAMDLLNAVPAQTYVLEDSNTGIASAKSAGAFVIGLRQNLLPGYVQHGADVYVDKVGDVIHSIDSKE